MLNGHHPLIVNTRHPHVNSYRSTIAIASDNNRDC